jgi:hypothetical protein
MRHIATALVLVGLTALPAAAQGRGGRYSERNQGVPPGQLPPAGQCRVWYEGRPPGQQPRATNCDEAERIASRDQYARVIYGTDRNARGIGNARGSANGRGTARRDRDIDNATRGRSGSVLSRLPIGRNPNARTGGGYQNEIFNNGYEDGVEKGREDADDRDSYDPVRHSRYRSADHGYDKRYGTKDDYKLIYRDGFEAGYQDGYRGTTRRR